MYMNYILWSKQVTFFSQNNYYRKHKTNDVHVVLKQKLYPFFFLFSKMTNLNPLFEKEKPQWRFYPRIANREPLTKM